MIPLPRTPYALFVRFIWQERTDPINRVRGVEQGGSGPHIHMRTVDNTQKMMYHNLCTCLDQLEGKTHISRCA